MKPPEKGVRLAELIAALSLATDLGMGQPMEKAMRGCLLSLELARRMGAGGDTLRDLYYLAMVQHIGCTAHAHEWAGYAGGDGKHTAAPDLTFETLEEAAKWIISHSE